MDAKRPILTLNGLVRPEEDQSLELATYDLLLPCRKFSVDHKVAQLGRVSLTAEFLLRLLKSVDGMEEGEVAKFFGFSLRDMSFVLTEVEGLGYVERREGRLYLTLAGSMLFQPNSDQPQIFDVESRREHVGFDLISLAYEPLRGLDEFERRLPELPLLNPELASNATSKVPEAFRRYYPEIISRFEQPIGERRALYSIDDVRAGERFSSTVRFTVRSTGLRPWAGTADLSAWRTEAEQEDRIPILEAVSAFVDDLTVNQRSDDQEAYDTLLSLAPEFLRDFAKKDGLAVDRYYREAFTRVGEVRSDRQTVPIVGSLLGRENIRKVTDVLSYGLRSGVQPSVLLWLTPMVRNWAATRMLPDFLRNITAKIGRQVDETAEPHLSVGLVAGRADAHISKAFDLVGSSDSPHFPRSLEVLVIPGVLAAASVHAPIGSKSGLPVPLGVLSFDHRVVSRATEYLSERLNYYIKDVRTENSILAELDRISVISPLEA